jgi:polyisoprenyl-phosphate glycosyltransferase
MQLTIAMPVYEDWESAVQLVRKIDQIFRSELQIHISFLLIDDGSQSSPPNPLPFIPEIIDRVTVLPLRRNLGHQRAIAVGLCYLLEHRKGDAVVVMDADGEDRPEDIPELLAAMAANNGRVAVFAERGRRYESLGFRFFYQCYRIFHRFLASRDIRFGNFSVLPWGQLESLAVYPELWNHYAATFLKSRLPYVRRRVDRGTRLAGKSRMNFIDLFVHGLSALFANQEVVGTRLLVASLITTLVLFAAIAVVIAVRLFTNLGIPGWATSTIGLLLILVAQSVIGFVVLVFSTMMNRSQLGFLPVRDYAYFIRPEFDLYSR